MFRGSIPQSVQQILVDIVKKWDVADIYIGCSGNFTIERALHGVVSASLHSNDVTVYSCLLGAYFSGQSLNAKYKEIYDGPMSFVRDYMKDDAGVISVALLLSEMAIYLATKPNPYYLKMIEAYKRQWNTLFETTATKIRKIAPFLKSFYAGDVIEWVDSVPEEHGFICYPPFYSGDYEKMFSVIESVIDWEPPHYDMINKDKIFDMFRKLIKRDHFMFGTNDELPEFRDYLRGISQTTNRGVTLYLYSKADKSRVILPSQNVASPMIERLGAQEDVGEVIKLIVLKPEHFHSLRSQYMNPYIKPGQESSSYGVMVGGKLIGVYAFSASPTLAHWSGRIDTPTMYLLSDFPVAPTKYKRLDGKFSNGLKYPLDPDCEDAGQVINCVAIAPITGRSGVSFISRLRHIIHLIHV